MNTDPRNPTRSAYEETLRAREEGAKRVTVVVGGQFGSEGKGAICAELHRRFAYDAGIRIGGPNAGHTCYDDQGNGYPLRTIPVAAAVDPEAELIVAPGSEVDPEVLEHELRMLEMDGHEVRHRLVIDERATFITPGNKQEEAELTHGSTHKGIGAARAARALRRAKLVGDQISSPMVRRFEWDARKSYLIEGTQGYGLGTHAGYYPFCTSGDCRAIDFLAQAGAPPFLPELDVWVVARTYPIRIAGNSGPLKYEMTWDEVGVPAEFTTVTKKMRRVGGWDGELVRRAVEANGGRRVSLALSFADYWWPELHGQTELPPVTMSNMSMWAQLAEVEDEVGAKIRLLGTGPRTCIFL